MNLFEAGILEQMTTIEYEKNLGIQNSQSEQSGSTTKSNANNKQKKQESSGLQPINIQMLQGAFFMLLGGNFLAGFILLVEMLEHRWKMVENFGLLMISLILWLHHLIIRVVRNSIRIAADRLHDIF